MLIIQHPQLEQKQPPAPLQIALGVVDDPNPGLGGTRITYTTNTNAGASGSPCFSDRWELVALHHSGTLQRNEGIPFTAILARLKRKGLRQLLVAAVQDEKTNNPDLRGLAKRLVESDAEDKAKERGYIVQIRKNATRIYKALKAGKLMRRHVFNEMWQLASLVGNSEINSALLAFEPPVKALMSEEAHFDMLRNRDIIMQQLDRTYGTLIEACERALTVGGQK